MISSIFLAVYGLVVIVYASAGGAVGLADRFWAHTILTAAGGWAIGPVARMLILRALASAHRTVDIPDAEHAVSIDEVAP